MITFFSKVGIKGSSFNLVTGFHQNDKGNIIANGETVGKFL